MTKTIPMNSISTHPANVRQGDIGAIVESLKAHGQYRPIVVQESTGHILAGNHTFKAAQALKWKQIEATLINCDDDEALRILLVDNRANDLANYDDNALAHLLTTMMQTDKQLTGTGYDPTDLDDLLTTLNQPPLPTTTKPTPQPPTPQQCPQCGFEWHNTPTGIQPI